MTAGEAAVRTRLQWAGGVLSCTVHARAGGGYAAHLLVDPDHVEGERIMEAADAAAAEVGAHVELEVEEQPNEARRARMRLYFQKWIRRSDEERADRKARR